MNGKFVRVMLAAILAVAGWSAFHVWQMSEVIPIPLARREIGLRTILRSEFRDDDGLVHQVVTTRGEFDDNESAIECVHRHQSNLVLMMESFQ